MGVRVRRFPEYGVTLIVYSGALTADVLREHVNRLAPDDVIRCIHYGHPTLDISGIDVASFPVLRRDLGEALRRIGVKSPTRVALVSDSPTAPLTLKFWPSYVGHDAGYPVEPVAFASLEAACEALGLPLAGRRAVIEAARSGESPASESPAGENPPGG